jgi:hypothetical protein
LFPASGKIRQFFMQVEHYQLGSVVLLNAIIYAAIGVSSMLPAFQSPLFDD